LGVFGRERLTMSYTRFMALLCSPNNEDRVALAALFHSLDVTLISTHHTKVAGDLLRGRRFQLVLLDLDCDPDWKETIDRFHALAPEVTVIVYSRLADEQHWLDALEAGAADFISKPFSKPELDWVLETALHQEAHFASSLTR
jgi:DNA-binding response OmpR family regulator